MSRLDILIETIGWLSTFTFLISIIIPQRIRLHELGLFTAVTTGIYAYYHGATAIWVKWLIAFFFHGYMWWKLKIKTTDEKQK
ncbi:MAG: hypothetical protein ACXVCP_11140 [Bdellovibrio sp.]